MRDEERKAYFHEDTRSHPLRTPAHRLAHAFACVGRVQQRVQQDADDQKQDADRHEQVRAVEQQVHAVRRQLGQEHTEQGDRLTKRGRARVRLNAVFVAVEVRRRRRR